MYAIATIIYGIPITSALSRKADKDEMYLEECGFEMLYSGGAEDDVGYMGYKCGEFDECADAIRFSELEQMKASLPEFEKEAVLEKVRQFSLKYPELAEVLIQAKISVDFYLVWSTS